MAFNQQKNIHFKAINKRKNRIKYPYIKIHSLSKLRFFQYYEESTDSHMDNLLIITIFIDIHFLPNNLGKYTKSPKPQALA